MEQYKTNVGSVVLAIIITVVVAGSGVYYFQKSTAETAYTIVETPIAVTSQAPQKSLEEYFATREGKFLNSGIGKSPSAMGWEELTNVAVSCPDILGTPCNGRLLIVSKDSLHLDNQFYLALTLGYGYKYYGPFTDDIRRLINESKAITSLDIGVVPTELVPIKFESSYTLSGSPSGPTFAECTLNGRNIPCREMPNGFFFKSVFHEGVFNSWIAVAGEVLGIFALIFWLWMIIDVIRNKKEDKVMWLVLIILFNLSGAIIYYFAQKRKMVKAVKLIK